VAESALPRRLILIMALAAGVGVANAYFPQAVTPLLARDLNVSEGAATTVATTAQLGYAAGIFLLVPLGDRLPRRPLIVTMFGVVALGLFLAGTSNSLAVLAACCAVVGALTVVPQILIPMVADLTNGSAAPLGVVQGGLLGGVLLARAFGGGLGQWLGWRAPFLVAGVLALLLALTLLVALPSTRSANRQSYPALLGSALRLARTEPELRRSCTYQALLFGGFTAAWTSIALFLTGPAFGYGTGVVGLVALVGAASVFAVPVAGRWIDRRGPDLANLVCFLGLGLAALVLLVGLAHGWVGLGGLILGMLLLDVSVQSSQVANQARIFALIPGARSRLNSIYMTSVFLGGAGGSWVGARAYLAYGWWAVCALIALVAVAALLRHLLRRDERAAEPLPVSA
jgi:predicted MFS family arabinose efflux permease